MTRLPEDIQAHDRRTVELILAGVDRLPTLSPVAARLLALGADEDAALEEVIALVENDPALSATVLAMCRRADRGIAEPVDTARRAIVLLGLDAVRTAILGTHVIETLGVRAAGRPAGVDREGLWRHCVAVACCAEHLAERTPALDIDPGAAFTAGLLHDLGRIALDAVLPKAYARVATLAEQRGCDAAAVEREILGLDHHAAGRRLAERWGLPRPIADVMRLHAQPPEALPEAAARPLIALVALADAICRAAHIGWSGDFGEPRAPDALADPLGVGAHREPGFLGRLASVVGERCTLLGLGAATAPDLLIDALQRANDRLSRQNARLRRRSRDADRRARVLREIHAFSSARLAGGPEHAAERVAASAASAIGCAFAAVAILTEPGAPWTLHVPGLPPRVMDDPPVDAGDLLAALAPGASTALRATAAFDWIASEAPEIDPRSLRVLPVSTRARPLALLVHDAPGPRRRAADAPEPDGPALAPLVACWAAELAAAVRREEAERLGDQLAAAHRTLAETQERLTEARSLARLGEMSAGAAHEMNNPLTIIRGRSQLLARRLASPTDRADAEAVADAAEHLSTLISSMHLLASPPTPHPEPFAAADLLADAVRAARQRVRPPLTPPPCTVEVSDNTPPMLADRGLLAAALAELLLNAWEAHAAADASEPVRVVAAADHAAGRFRVTVFDRGRGLSPRARSHAFDPFFSEKPAGRQTGLGLSRARVFTDLHDGSIALAPRVGGGTAATLEIPLPGARKAARAA